MKKLITLITIFIVLITVAAALEENEKPYWLLFETAEKEYENKRYDKALSYYKMAIQKRNETNEAEERPYPEAVYGIGKVYFAQAELRLAKIQYNKSLEMRQYFAIPGEYYNVLFELAEIYRYENKTGEYENILIEVIHDETFSLMNEYEGSFRGRGIDMLLHLYRHARDHEFEAISKLGKMYYERNEYQTAIPYLVTSVMCSFTEIITYVKQKDPEYNFSDSVNPDYRYQTTAVKKLLREYRFYDKKYVLLINSELITSVNILENTLEMAYVEELSAHTRQLLDLIKTELDL